MRLSIEFATDNAAFHEGHNLEVMEVLENLALVIPAHSPGDDGSIKDSNGNTIGRWEWR